jgi:hypothetical protein
MPWECKTVEEKRIEFVIALKNGSSKSAACRRFGITRNPDIYYSRSDQNIQLIAPNGSYQCTEHNENKTVIILP